MLILSLRTFSTVSPPDFHFYRYQHRFISFLFRLCNYGRQEIAHRNVRVMRTRATRSNLDSKSLGSLEGHIKAWRRKSRQCEARGQKVRWGGGSNRRALSAHLSASDLRVSLTHTAMCFARRFVFVLLKSSRRPGGSYEITIHDLFIRIWPFSTWFNDDFSGGGNTIVASLAWSIFLFYFGTDGQSLVQVLAACHSIHRYFGSAFCFYGLLLAGGGSGISLLLSRHLIRARWHL
ncbi:hypothetical protein B0T22DRAFT_57879 [Podospora appendiculata]|uniref:Uncharacterized protein n=1 Tax=Podospora appendiculata TaxID=314037 RepID=A0AAE0XIH7_9PEZI|nr:hypothetical protein B0T22DRAFT_57879 [Podospora appendiculata]